MSDDERRCLFCGESIEGRRADARYCGSGCRVEASRMRRLLEGERDGHYVSARDRMVAYGKPRRRRTHSRSGR